ncbi:MAG: hypothetical protein COU33_02035 [Candidatus Magasanikbacteria bacterium CG10_big_fil_rev_8_21_14_0_10_43_6]|uniref:Uncharacterized protein n=1 Tax=Candidatus Magasanikbacteria bacterium CG10_big_fil_rev_8_21_14_0_10_43_6 TaxID=1974650 RepID=A0A2M6W1F4_9BACT|nr:MAG: hypothetical protein COU33_02035 [Candidatus Magasanikbacteria bacterium CG10_big_fil_rev_8_21_14_0_10_43_6]
MESTEHVVSATHDCCGITETGQEEIPTATGIDHHAPTVATLSFLDLLIALLVIFVAVALPEPARKILISQFQLYVRTWLQRWSYFALYVRQLFSMGILHPKIW